MDSSGCDYIYISLIFSSFLCCFLESFSVFLFSIGCLRRCAHGKPRDRLLLFFDAAFYSSKPEHYGQASGDIGSIAARRPEKVGRRSIIIID